MRLGNRSVLLYSELARMLAIQEWCMAREAYIISFYRQTISDVLDKKAPANIHLISPNWYSVTRILN